MPLAFRNILALIRRQSASRLAFCALIVCGLFFLEMPISSQGQGLNPADLLQLQQRLNSDPGQQTNGLNGAQNQNSYQPIIIQPASAGEDRSPLAVSRLEQILSLRAGSKLKQFGYDQLGRGTQVVVSQAGAMQDDYVLGPGDEIIVSMRGQENSEVRTSVNRNGQVLLPRLNPISASGRAFGQVREDIQAAVQRTYVATTASVAVGRIRQISVLVSGEVNLPGSRVLTGLSSAVDALLVSGGVKKTGSLRSIRIQRGARQYTVDLYGVITGQGQGSLMRLMDGDRIVVPPLGGTVAVTGVVRQPGIYELPAGHASLSVRTLMALAGGPEVRGRLRLSALRVMADGQTQMTDLPNERGEVRDSEILFVQFGADQVTSRATLGGATSLGGAYPIVSGTRLSQVIKAPGALGDSPYTPFGIIVRKNPATLMRGLLPFTPIAVLAGREDMALQSDDLIRVLSTNEIELLNYVVRSYLQSLTNQQSVIRNPLAQVSSDTSVARSVASQSGQNNETFDLGSVPASVQRQQVNALLATIAPGSVQNQRQAEVAIASQQTQREISLLRQQQSLEDQTSGLDSQDPRETRDARDRRDPRDPRDLRDTRTTYQAPLEQAPPGGSTSSPDKIGRDTADRARFSPNEEVQNFGQLARQLGVDPLVLMNFLVDNRVQLDGAVRGPGSYFVGPSTSLQELVQAAGGTLNWADESGVELISTTVDRQTGRSAVQKSSVPLNKEMLASYVVRPRDQIRFKQVFSDIGQGAVTVQGEVRAPGSFTIVRGEHLSDLLARAGGLTNTAYPYGAVFLRQSVAQKEREGFVRAANEVQNQLIVAMTRIGNDKVSPDTFASMQTFVSELRSQKGVGRISVVADPSVLAANPSLDPLLESGDVIYIPPRPSSITVLGQVLQPGSYPFRRSESLRDYIERAGGYSALADSSQTFVILPDGSARRVETSWFSLGSADNLPPGSTIMVPRDITPLDLRQTVIDVSQIFSQFAVAIASVAVLAKQ